MTLAAVPSMRIEEILRAARDRCASDVHLCPGEAPIFRIDGELVRRTDAVLTESEIESFVSAQLDARARGLFATDGSCDIAIHSSGVGRVRIHAFRATSGMRCAIRLFPADVPPIESFDLPKAVEQLALQQRGLVLIVGPTGSGKTTLLAAMVDLLNRQHSRHIVTFEDPIEYQHRSKHCLIAQCEIGRDAPDFAHGLRGALRADPDVIVIGELRDAAALRTSLSAAETGHLVLASMHTSDAPQALDRILDMFSFEGRQHVRAQMAAALTGVVALRLAPRAGGKGRRAVAEILIATDAVRNLIREGKTHQLRSAIQTGRASGMQTLEMHLSSLIARGELTMRTALHCAQRPAEVTAAERTV